MPTEKWTPIHWRHGCWVNAHTRSNGATVKRHWRSGANVRGHYSANNPDPMKPPGSARSSVPRAPRIAWPRPAKPNHATPIVVPPSLNNAALALALARNPSYQVQPQPQGDRPHGLATLVAVIYTDANNQRHLQSGLTTAMAAVTIPDQTRQITLECSIALPDQETHILRLDTPLFFNADETVATIHGHGHQINPEQVNRILERLKPASREPAASARRRNSVRQSLGANDPEQAVRHAITDILALAPPPDLNLTQPVTIPCPGTGYAITVHPLHADPVQNSPRKRRSKADPTSAR